MKLDIYSNELGLKENKLALTEEYVMLEWHLSDYFRGGLPEDLFKMTEKEINDWYEDHEKEDIPNLVAVDLAEVEKISVSDAINLYVHNHCEIVIEYDDGRNNIISCDGMASFVFRLLEAMIHKCIIFVD
jgi:hypothetical protein